MVSYQECGQSALVDQESGPNEPVETKPKQWRRLGFGLVVLGAMCVGAYTQIPESGVAAYLRLTKRTATPRERLAKLRKGILSLVEDKEEDPKLSGSAALKALPEDMTEVDRNGISIEATLESKEEVEEDMAIEMVFSSKEGKAEDLKADFDALMAAAKDAFAEQGEAKAWEEFEKQVEISVLSSHRLLGLVSVKLLLPDDEKADEMLEQGMHDDPPKFVLNVATSRSLQDMIAHKEESVWAVHGGVDISVDAEFARKAIDAAERIGAEDLEKEPFMPETQAEKEFEIPLDWLASIGMTTKLTYRPEKLTGTGMTFEDVMRMCAMMLQDLPKPVKDAVKKLPDSADGLKFVNILGLPDKREITMELHNFHFIPFLAATIEFGDEGGDDEEPADDEPPAEKTADEMEGPTEEPAEDEEEKPEEPDAEALD